MNVIILGFIAGAAVYALFGIPMVFIFWLLTFIQGATAMFGLIKWAAYAMDHEKETRSWVYLYPEIYRDDISHN